MPQDDEVVFTIQIRPEAIEVEGHIGADADETEAFACASDSLVLSGTSTEPRL